MLRRRAAESKQEQPLADGAEAPTQAQEDALPTMAVEKAKQPVRVERKAEPEVEARKASAPEPKPASNKHTALASPAVRQRARDLGIDLAEVKTASDRVRHSDLDAYLLYNGGSVSGRGAAPRPDETIKVVGLRRKIAENMQEAKRRIPHFSLVEEFDVTALEETRAMMNADRGDNPKLTVLPFLITAMARALPDWPMLNATYDDDANVITRVGALNLGMATQTPNGLMVPVIRDAQSKSVWQLAAEILRLAEAARSGKAEREELSGSSITLSSLGPMGGIASTPVINRPEVAIIAVNKVGGESGGRRRRDRDPQTDEPVAVLRSPRRRRLGRGQLPSGAQGPDRESAPPAELTVVPTLDYVTLDVFTDRAFGGNPLAIIPDARGLDSAAMQRIATEFNYSETTFILPPPEGSDCLATVRIFTPVEELPFAGHPNVGTAFHVASLDELFGQPVGDRFRFSEKAGMVDCRIRRDGDATFRQHRRTPPARDRRNDRPGDHCRLRVAGAECGQRFQPCPGLRLGRLAVRGRRVGIARRPCRGPPRRQRLCRG